MTLLLSHGSMLLVLAWLVIGGLGIPVPEDAALLATGALVFHGLVTPEVAIPIVFAGVLAGDAMLFLFARRLGPKALDHPRVQKLLPPARRVRLEAAYRRHGGRIVFLSRHIVGVRAATFALAGIHRMPLRRFLAWDALAACLSVPIVVGLGYLGALHLDRVRAGMATAEHVVLLVGLLAAAGYLVVRQRRAC